MHCEAEWRVRSNHGYEVMIGHLFSWVKRKLVKHGICNVFRFGTIESKHIDDLEDVEL